MKILYNKKDIQLAVEKVAQQIYSKHYHDPEPPVMICVLNGAFMFFTDLVKQVNLDCQIDFIRASSYKGRSQYDVQIFKDVEIDIKDKNIYLVDDIIDSGNTMNALIKYYTEYNPKSITPVALFKKYTSDMECIHGITLTNETWICGYGLDGKNGLFRNREVIFGFEPEID
jgi:hypoxanthine phosphoribosyltransferase